MRLINGFLIFALVAMFAGVSSLYGANDVSPSPYAIRTALTPNVNPVLGFDLLYDQCSDTTEIGAFCINSQNFETIYDAFDNEGADDFVVPAGEIWTINQVIALGIYYNGFGPAVSVNVSIWSNSGSLPGAVVYSAPSVVPTTDLSGSFLLDLSSPAVLVAGTYWLELQVNMDFDISGQWGWCENNVMRNSESAWRNTGGGFGTPCTAWGARVSSCVVGQDPDFLYCLYGTSEPAVDPCEDFTNFLARCTNSGMTQARVVLRDNIEHSGETVLFQIDETIYPATIGDNGVSSRASISITGLGAGDHVVSLVDPADCFPSITVTCPVAKVSANSDWEADEARWAAELERTSGTVVPSETKLLGNYPNPFNPSTTIRYALSTDSRVSVKVYNTLGQEIASLFDGFQKAGEQSITWNGTNRAGATVASGLYVYRVQADNIVLTEKMLFAK
jgi:hypothetical protein